MRTLWKHCLLCFSLLAASVTTHVVILLSNSYRQRHSYVYREALYHPPVQLPSNDASIDTNALLKKFAASSQDVFVLSSHLLVWLAERMNTEPDKQPRMEVTEDDVVFIVMASLQKRNRVAIQRASWMQWARHVVVIAEGFDDELGIITLPDTVGKTGFAHAQLRQLHGMKWLSENRPDLIGKKWYFLVDDDTWVNVPTLLSYLSPFSSNLPLSFSHIYRFNGMALYNGGAGMLFSQAAYDVLADAVFTAACPLTDLKPGELNNDNILSACAFRNSILKVTSSKFSSYLGAKLLDLRAESSWLDQITVHKVEHALLAEKMFCWSEHYHGKRPPQMCTSHITYV